MPLLYSPAPDLNYEIQRLQRLGILDRNGMATFCLAQIQRWQFLQLPIDLLIVAFCTYNKGASPFIAFGALCASHSSIQGHDIIGQS